MASQILERVFPSMFQRRLVLLLGLIALSMLMLAVKLGHLTVVKGERLTKEAEANLLRSQWTPTVRGKITDRKGRVLATDRAAYDVAIGYPMIAGTWAQEQAEAFVKNLHREQWSEFSEAQRQELTARALPAYKAHVNQAWEDLSGLTHVPREDIEGKAGKIKEQVERMHRHLIELAEDAQRKEAGKRDEAVTPELERAIQRRANQPIAEMKIAHRLLHRVSDPIAFDVQFLIGERIDLIPLPGEKGARSVDRVERIPGLAVFDSGDREYPCESMTVEVDKSTFPGQLKAPTKVTMAVDGVAAHVLGWMRDEVFAEDNRGLKDPKTGQWRGGRQQFLAENRAAAAGAILDLGGGRTADRGEYREGDRVGTAGAEGGYEDSLRGLRGRLTRQIDTGATTSLHAEPGHDLTLTIDAMLQARIQAIMTPRLGLAKVQPWHRGATESPNPTMPDGSPVLGAAVVLDVDSGDILAMVSMPEFTREQRRSDTDALREWFKDPVEVPLLNRAIARGYPPGSIVKPLILCGAVQRGRFSLDQRVACNGHLLPDDENKYRCWIFKRSQNSGRFTHSGIFGHDLRGSEAIMVSCNVFFFTMGQRLGPIGISDVYREFGVGRTFGLNIGEEERGRLGKKGDGSDLAAWDAIQMGIGQGPVTWTPLHAASAYATIARYGFAIPPRLVLDGRSPEASDLKLDARVVAEALEGLHLSANNDEHGTGNHLTLADGRHEPIFNAPGVEVWGKTGTAQASRVFAPRDPPPPEEAPDADHDGENPTPPSRPTPRELLREGDHSWFVVLVGKKGDRPRYAISVVMEYAGSGGRVSGPIVNQIIHALITEGYL